MATAKKKTTKKSLVKSKKVSTANLSDSTKIDYFSDSSGEAKKSRVSPLKLILLVVILGLIFIAYKNREMFVAGMVNNQPITAWELNSRMKDAYGQQTFDQIVVERLLKSEAQKRNVSVSQDEINAELANVEKNLGGVVSLDEALAQQGMTKNQLVEQIKLRLLVSKMVGDNIVVNDDEVNKYLEANKDFVEEGADPEKTKSDIKNYLREQKINEEIQKLIRDLKEKANIVSYI